MRISLSILALLFAALTQAVLHAQPSLDAGAVAEAAGRLKAGEFLWAPEVAPEGPVLLVVSLATQRAVIYRNGIPIGISTVSTGRPGHRTPAGVFTVLQRRVEHYSSLYNNAPMPYMQRLTWGGVALHGGHLPGYPASHGCIRLPHEFARLLYGVTRLGMTVIVTESAAVPHIAPEASLLGAPSAASPMDAGVSWHPELSRSGPVSIVISAADRRLVVLRNGVVIGSAPVIIDGSITRMSAFVMREAQGAEQGWLRIDLPGQNAEAQPDLRGRIHVAETFRRSVQTILQPGTTVVVTGDSLRSGRGQRPVTVVEGQLDPAQ
jgi:hypothetical protein